MTYTELEAEIEQAKRWIENFEFSIDNLLIENAESVELHCMLDQLSAMEEALETMFPEE